MSETLVMTAKTGLLIAAPSCSSYIAPSYHAENMWTLLKTKLIKGSAICAGVKVVRLETLGSLASFGNVAF